MQRRLTRFHIARIATAIALAAGTSPCLQAAPAAQPLSIDAIHALEGTGRFDDHRLVVKFRTDATEADQQRALQLLQPEAQRSLHRGTRRALARYHAVRLNRQWSVSAAIAQLRHDPAVEDVQPDWLLQLQDGPPANDPGFSSLWGMQGATTTPASPYGTGVAALWQQGYVCASTRPVYVAVLDTGVRTTHEDLRDNIFINPGDPTADGTDNDGNGFIDDVKGWNFYAHTNNVEDDHSHGSHVAGTIAARHNNSLGVAGLCGDGAVKIIPVKVCSSSGSCPSSAVLEAMSYVVDLKTHHGINVAAVNLSLGSLSDSPSTYGIEYFQAARDANIMVAAAAGNNGADTDVKFMWPASLEVENILSVGNLMSNGQLSSSSNHGTTSVDVAAPGSSIYSTVNTNDSAYNWKSGTSMASPHVAGALALYRVLHPDAGVQDTRDGLLGSAAVEPTLEGKIAGARRLDLSHWAWGAGTAFKTQCGTNLTRKTTFWLGTTAYADASMSAPLRQMGITMKAFDATGKLLDTYTGKTDDNGRAMWMFSGTQYPWGTQFSVNIHTDNGGDRTYTSTELHCYGSR